MQGDTTTPPPEGSGTRRIASGTLIRALGEVLGKLGSVAFFVIAARELGGARFGDFIFALALAEIMFRPAGFGTDQLLTREVARERRRLDELFGDVFVFKSLAAAALLALMAVVVAVLGYDSETVVAMSIVGLGVALEGMGKTVHSVLQGFEAQRYLSASLVLQRLFTAAVGAVVLLNGGGLLEVSIVFAAGAVVGLVSAAFWQWRRVVAPVWDVARERWWPLARRAAPLGLVIAVATILHRVDATMLGLLSEGTDNTDVGEYGAATRIVFATSFLSWAFAGAAMPWLSREREDSDRLGRGLELGVKALVIPLLPVAVAFGLLAEPIIDLLYGEEFDGAIVPLRIFAVMAVLYAINSYVATVMISRNRPGDVTRVSVLILVQNVLTNFAVIPLFGTTGAAANAVFSSALLALIVSRRATRVTGPVSARRIFAAPVAGGIVLALVIAAFGFELSVFSAFAGAIAYALGYLLAERLLYPGDFGIFAAAITRGRIGGAERGS